MSNRTYSGDSQTELAHRMESGRASVQDLLNELGDSGASSPVLGKFDNLFLSRDFTGDEEPEEAFRKRF